MKITYTFIMKVLPALLAALCWTSCSDFLEEDPKGQLLRIPISATRKIWMLH
jgi:hypothetical protein